MSADANALQTKVMDFINEAKSSFEKAVDQLKTNKKLEQKELLYVSFAYLAVFGVVGLFLADLATTVYGGDEGREYADDWCSSACAANLGLAALAVVALNWIKTGDNHGALRDVHRVFTVSFGLQALCNLMVGLYGSLTDIVFVNALIDALLAYFHAVHGELIPGSVAGSGAGAGSGSKKP